MEERWVVVHAWWGVGEMGMMGGRSDANANRREERRKGTSSEARESERHRNFFFFFLLESDEETDGESDSGHSLCERINDIL